MYEIHTQDPVVKLVVTVVSADNLLELGGQPMVALMIARTAGSPSTTILLSVEEALRLDMALNKGIQVALRNKIEEMGVLIKQANRLVDKTEG